MYNCSYKDIFGKNSQCFCLTLGFAFALFCESNFRMVSFLKVSLAKSFSICSMASLCCLSSPELLPISALVWSNLVCRLDRLPFRCWFSLFVKASLFLDIKITNLLKVTSLYLSSSTSSLCRAISSWCQSSEFRQMSVLFCSCLNTDSFSSCFALTSESLERSRLKFSLFKLRKKLNEELLF